MTQGLQNPDLVNQTYRLAVFAVFTPDQEQKASQVTDKNNVEAVAWRRDADGLCSIKMRMPDGSTEYWKQTDAVRDPKTGFKAAAFERRNEDGSTYLEKGRSPITIIDFAGNTNTDQDIQTAKNFTHGEHMDAVYNQVEAFVDKTVGGMRARAEAEHHDMGSVTVGTHSMGAIGLGAATRLREYYGFTEQNTRTLVLEPLGAGQVLKELAVREAKKDYGQGDARYTPSRPELQAEMDRLLKNVTCIRADKSTIISDLVTGNKYNDNAMIGESYHYKTVEKTVLDKVGAGVIDNHLAGYVASSMLTHKNPLDPLPPQKPVSADDAYLVSQGDRLWRDFKTAALLGAPALKNMLVSAFDTKAGQATAVDLHEKPAAVRQNFLALNLPAPTPEKPISNKIVTVMDEPNAYQPGMIML